jgi:hypothetical protein
VGAQKFPETSNLMSPPAEPGVYLNEIKELGSSPIYGIEYLVKASQGSGRKSRFRRKPWRDKLWSKGPMSFRKAQRGQEKHDSEDWRTSPPEPRRGMCLMIVAESAFPSGPLEAQHNLPIPPYFPSRKLEMIQELNGSLPWNPQKILES